MDARLTTHRTSGHYVLALDGPLDLAAVPRLHDALHRLVADHPGEPIAVDLDGVTVLDDTSLGLLVGAAAAARDLDSALRVVCNDERLRRRLEHRRIDRIIDITDSLNGSPNDGTAYDQDMPDRCTP